MGNRCDVTADGLEGAEKGQLCAGQDDRANAAGSDPSEDAIAKERAEIWGGKTSLRQIASNPDKYIDQVLATEANAHQPQRIASLKEQWESERKAKTPPKTHGTAALISYLAFVGANAFDAYSSQGKMEGNGVLANKDGTFGGWRSYGIKFGVVGVMGGLEWLIHRNKVHETNDSRKTDTAIQVVNYTAAAALTAVAARNMTIPRPGDVNK